MSYVIQAPRYAESLGKIRAAAEAAGCSLDGFVPAHLTFITLGRDPEAARALWVERLSRRYAQDFGPLADKYGFIGSPDQCAERIETFIQAGCRYFVLNPICRPEEQAEMVEALAAEIVPRFP